MNKIKRTLALVLILICAVMAVPSYTPLTAQVNAATAKKVQINKKSVTLNSGQTTKLKLKNTRKKPKWKSSNKKIATVSKTGKVTAMKKGTATITATLDKKNYKCKITVTVKKTKPAETPNANDGVWITATGKKYHSISNCGTTDPAKARKISLEDAISSGYEACSKCWH